ncbi:MAG: thermonuclease family protein [Edaphobacter sp.]|uniref:thermonuclease family protein n=1 Tax=Edaphobacter sp. TaxID=1934404 RepID=UPI0029815948|nr:thermonuclease family protein [Edaphobacter sp.]MDW5266318.1 thermonuclease family protein [Edaphobacter sp.]
MLRPLLIAACGPLVASHTCAESLVGQASAIDADTREIYGQRIRLLDIDAPESKQLCNDAGGTRYRCDQTAALELDDWIAARPVTCETAKLDRYGRLLTHSSVGGRDVATSLAANGLAVPYRDCQCEVVRDAAVHAKAQRRGVWSRDFVMPWDWRKQD